VLINEEDPHIIAQGNGKWLPSFCCVYHYSYFASSNLGWFHRWRDRDEAWGAPLAGSGRGVRRSL